MILRVDLQNCQVVAGDKRCCSARTSAQLLKDSLQHEAFTTKLFKPPLTRLVFNTLPWSNFNTVYFMEEWRNLTHPATPACCELYFVVYTAEVRLK